MTDRELLELAAKAAGIEVTGYLPTLGLQYVNGSEDSPYTDYWNPLEDDGDAFRLSVKLKMMVDVGGGGFCTADCVGLSSSVNELDTDFLKATRRAIVRAAAEIGKGME